MKANLILMQDNLLIKLATLSFLLLIVWAVPLKANAQIVKYNLQLNGSNVSPTNTSPATGYGYVIVNIGLKIMDINIVINNLTSFGSSAHLHAATTLPYSGNCGLVVSCPLFPQSPLSFIYFHSFDMTMASSYAAGYITANGGTTNTAFTALTTAMAAGKSYFDVHTPIFSAGEIRGFLTPLYTFNGNGSWNNSANWEVNSIPPAILMAKGEIIIDPILGGECLLQLSTVQTITSGAKLTVIGAKKLRIEGSLIIQ